MSQPIWRKTANMAVSFWEEHKCSIIASFVAALCAYTFAFTNKLMCADEVENLFAKGTTVSSGRWGLEVTRLIFPDVSMPWIYGIITICFICVSCCLIIDTFSITNSALRVLIPTSIITFPSLIGTFAYMFTSASYGLAFFLTVMSVYLVKRGKWAASFFTLVLSLSIYQAYISVAASLLLLIIIQELILERQDLRQIIQTGIKYVLLLIFALGLYYLVSLIIASKMSDGFNNYAAASLHSTKDPMILRHYKAYFFYVAAILKGSFGLVQGGMGIVCHILLILSAGLCILKWLLQKENKTGNKIWIATCLALIPMAVNCMFLFVAEHAIHTLVLYGFAMNYVIVAVVLETTSKTVDTNGNRMTVLLEDLIVISLSIITAINIFTANKAYLKLHLDYENTYSFFTSLVADIKMTEGFNEESKIAIIGQTDNMVTEFGQLESLDIVGITVFELDANNTGRDKFIQRYCGFDAPFATEAELEWIKCQREFLQMNEYPYYGSIAKIDDYIVVKLSD